MHAPQRFLVVTADDFGIGPATTHGILDLALQGRVTATVLLVNSPHAEAAVRAWRQMGCVPELGWHPCLTLDRPVRSPDAVPSLVDGEGRFWPLGTFVKRLYLGRISRADIADELRAQWQRFCDLVGHPPTTVNSHHHVQVFAPVGELLRDILCVQHDLPYVRRIREPWRMLARVPGARFKRAILSSWGRGDARRLRSQGFPGNDWLAGVTDPPFVKDPDFLTRWLSRVPGHVVELTCHPGHADATLLGRDATPANGQLQRRPDELQLLRQPEFVRACADAGFTLIAPAQLRTLPLSRRSHAA